MIISMIAAMGNNRVIGKDNDIPWHLPDDFKFFKTTTSGHHVIMGRKNWESLPHNFQPLPGRPNIVITRQENYKLSEAEVVRSLEDALNIAKEAGEEEAFIIGGCQIYALGLEIADRMYITEIKDTFEGDAFFPEWNRDDWTEVSRVPHGIDERHGHAFDFVIYDRKK